MWRWMLACSCLALWAGCAHAEPWSSVFAAAGDTAVFLATDGTLFRAPFNLAARETLWRPAADQHVVRFATGAAGGRVAWIVRGFDDDTTRLWLAGPEGVHQRLRYFALVPRTHGQTFSEADVPTVADHGARGGRLVRTATLMLRRSANTLAWSADGRSVLLGYDGGLVSVTAGSREGWLLPGTLAIGLDGLRPSGLVLVDGLTLEDAADRPLVTAWDLAYTLGSTLVVREGRVVQPLGRSRTLFAPAPGGWRACARSDWAGAQVRTIGRSSLWWAEGRGIRALRQETCVATRELEALDEIVWLGYDAGRRDVLGASGRLLWRRPESGGPATTVLAASSPIRAILESRTSASVGVVAGDSLLAWNPGSGVVRRLALAGCEPRALFEGPDGSLVVQSGDDAGRAPKLARADSARGCLVQVTPPAGRGGVLIPVCGGAWLLSLAPAPRPAGRLHAYDMAANRWRVVENPGVSAWEPLR